MLHSNYCDRPTFEDNGLIGFLRRFDILRRTIIQLTFSLRCMSTDWQPQQTMKPMSAEQLELDAVTTVGNCSLARN